MLIARPRMIRQRTEQMPYYNCCGAFFPRVFPVSSHFCIQQVWCSNEFLAIPTLFRAGSKSLLLCLTCCLKEWFVKVCSMCTAQVVTVACVPYRTVPYLPPDRLFHALDSNKSGRISFDDFVVGLAVCCRGSLEEKMRFLFGVYDMNEVCRYTKRLSSYMLYAISYYVIRCDSMEAENEFDGSYFCPSQWLSCFFPRWILLVLLL